MFNNVKVSLSMLFFCVVMFFACVSVSEAATYYVNQTKDSDVPCEPGNSQNNICSLRGAFIAAQNNSDYSNNIYLNFSKSSVIKLDLKGSGENSSLTGDLNVNNKSVNIYNYNYKVVIDASDLNDRVFNVNKGYLSLSSVEIANGSVSDSETNYGGAIYSLNSYLTIQNSYIHNSKAGGLKGYGGAIYFGNDDSFNSSTRLQVLNSTISNNKASLEGGAIYFKGGYYYHNYRFDLVGSTLAENVTDSGMDNVDRSSLSESTGGSAVFARVLNYSFLNFDKSTVAYNKNVNSSGLSVSGGAVVVKKDAGVNNFQFKSKYVLVAKNSVLNGGFNCQLSDVSSDVVSEAPNLSDDSSCFFGSQDLVSSDPKILPLGFYSVGYNQAQIPFIPVMKTSSAVDVSDVNSAVDTSPNFVSVPFNNKVDIGSFEYSDSYNKGLIASTDLPSVVVGSTSKSFNVKLTNISSDIVDIESMYLNLYYTNIKKISVSDSLCSDFVPTYASSSVDFECRLSLNPGESVVLKVDFRAVSEADNASFNFSFGSSGNYYSLFGYVPFSIEKDASVSFVSNVNSYKVYSNQYLGDVVNQEIKTPYFELVNNSFESANFEVEMNKVEEISYLGLMGENNNYVWCEDKNETTIICRVYLSPGDKTKFYVTGNINTSSEQPKSFNVKADIKEVTGANIQYNKSQTITFNYDPLTLNIGFSSREESNSNYNPFNKKLIASTGQLETFTTSLYYAGYYGMRKHVDDGKITVTLPENKHISISSMQLHNSSCTQNENNINQYICLITNLDPDQIINLNISYYGETIGEDTINIKTEIPGYSFTEYYPSNYNFTVKVEDTTALTLEPTIKTPDIKYNEWLEIEYKITNNTNKEAKNVNLILSDSFIENGIKEIQTEPNPQNIKCDKTISINGSNKYYCSIGTMPAETERIITIKVKINEPYLIGYEGASQNIQLSTAKLATESYDTNYNNNLNTGINYSTFKYTPVSDITISNPYTNNEIAGNEINRYVYIQNQGSSTKAKITVESEGDTKLQTTYNYYGTCEKINDQKIECANTQIYGENSENPFYYKYIKETPGTAKIKITIEPVAEEKTPDNNTQTIEIENTSGDTQITQTNNTETTPINEETAHTYKIKAETGSTTNNILTIKNNDNLQITNIEGITCVEETNKDKTCEIGTLTKNQEKTITITVKSSTEGTHELKTEIKTTPEDSNINNNTLTTNIKIEPKTIITATNDKETSTIQEEQTTTINTELKIEQSNAENLKAKITIPEGLELTELESADGTCSKENKQCVFNTINKNTTLNIKTTLKAKTAGTYTFKIEGQSTTQNKTTAATTSITIDSKPIITTPTETTPTTQTETTPTTPTTSTTLTTPTTSTTQTETTKTTPENTTPNNTTPTTPITTTETTPIIPVTPNENKIVNDTTKIKTKFDKKKKAVVLNIKTVFTDETKNNVCSGKAEIIVSNMKKKTLLKKKTVINKQCQIQQNILLKKKIFSKNKKVNIKINYIVDKKIVYSTKQLKVKLAAKK